MPAARVHLTLIFTVCRVAHQLVSAIATLSGGLEKKCRCWARGPLVFDSSPLLNLPYFLSTGRTRTRVGFKAHRNHRRQSIRNQECGVLALQARPGSPQPPMPWAYPHWSLGPVALLPGECCHLASFCPAKSTCTSETLPLPQTSAAKDTEARGQARPPSGEP